MSRIADVLLRYLPQMTDRDRSLLIRELTTVEQNSYAIGTRSGTRGQVDSLRAGNVNISPADGVTLINPATGKRSVYLNPNGDASFGSDIDTPADASLIIFSNGQIYNGEVMGEGDVLLGDNTLGAANMLWDRSTGKLIFRGGVTSQLYLGTDGSLYAGAGNVRINASGLAFLDTDFNTTRVNWKYQGTTLGSLVGDYAGSGDGVMWMLAYKDTGYPWTKARVNLSVIDYTATPDTRARMDLISDGTIDFFTGTVSATPTLSISGGDLYTTPLTDISGSVTITGWTTYTTKEVFYKKVGKTVYLWISISGTSNNAATNIVVPVSCAASPASFQNPARCRDNGTWNAGLVVIGNTDNVVDCYSTIAGGAWTATGTKSVYATLVYEAAS